MHRPAYNALKKSIPHPQSGRNPQALIFVSDRKQARLTALDFVNFVQSEASDKDKHRFIDCQDRARFIQEYQRKISEHSLKSTLEYGIGFLHDGMNDSEKEYIK